MVDFDRLASMLRAAGMDALIAVGPKNVQHLTQMLMTVPWLSDVHGIATCVTVFSPPDKSFAVGWRKNFPGALYGSGQTLEARLPKTAEQLRERGLDGATIGVDMDYTPSSGLALLRDALPLAHFVPADLLLAKLRSVKSPEELSRMKTATAISEGAFQDVRHRLREGVTANEMASAWAKAVIDRGAMPVCAIPFDFVSQEPHGHGQPVDGLIRAWTHLERGLTTRFTFCVLYKGYYCDHKIAICAGEPSPEAVAVYDRHRARQEFIRGFLKPGMTKRQVHEACIGAFTGLQQDPFWIHGVGMDTHEEPRLGTLMPESVDVKPELAFEENTVVALDASWLVGDLYVLRKDGLERLNELPQHILSF